MYQNAWGKSTRTGWGGKLGWRIFRLCGMMRSWCLTPFSTLHPAPPPASGRHDSSLRSDLWLGAICAMPACGKALYMTMSDIQHNPHMREFYQRMISQGKHKMVAHSACTRCVEKWSTISERLDKQAPCWINMLDSDHGIHGRPDSCNMRPTR